MRMMIKELSVLCVAIAFLLTSCVTNIREQADPYFGYVYINSMRDKMDPTEFSRLQEIYRRQIAQNEYDALKKVGPSKDSKFIADWKLYYEKLDENIKISEPDWDVAGYEMKPKELSQLRNRWVSLQDELSFRGSDYCEEWKIELSRVSNQKLQYSGEAQKLVSGISSCIEEGNYLKAVEHAAELEQYMVVDSKIREKARKFWRKKIEEGLNAAEKVKNLSAQEELLLSFNHYILEREKYFDGDDALARCSDDVVESIGLNWCEQIRGYGKSGKYRKAYKFVLDRFNQYSEETSELGPHWSRLRGVIGNAYDGNDVLIAAIRHYGDAGSTELGQNPGLAYIYLCAAEEMLDLRVRLGIDDVRLSAEGAEWVEKIFGSGSLKKKVVEEIERQMSRKLIVLDAEPGCDLPEIDKKLRESLEDVFGSGNSNAWALVVSQEPLRDLIKTNSQDYVVRFKNIQLELNYRYKDETSEVRRRLGLGDNAIIENPFKKDKSSPYRGEKTIIEQVVQYYIKSEKVEWYTYEKADIAVALFCGSTEQPLINGTSATLKGQRACKDYKSVQYTPTRTEKCYYHINESAVVDEHGFDNTASALLSKSEVYENFCNDVVHSVLAVKLIDMISQYPAICCRDALADKKSGGGEVPYYNELGKVLLYAVRLSGNEAELTNPEGYEWYHLRDAVQNNSAVWCESRWAEFNAETKDVLSNLWGTCAQFVEDSEDDDTLQD